MQPLTLPDIHEDVLAALRAAGYDTVDKVLEARAEDLLALPGFDQETVDAVVAAAGLEKAAQPVAEPADAAEVGAGPSEMQSEGGGAEPTE